jgi:hypothetical protein
MYKLNPNDVSLVAGLGAARSNYAINEGLVICIINSLTANIPKIYINIITSHGEALLFYWIP